MTALNGNPCSFSTASNEIAWAKVARITVHNKLRRLLRAAKPGVDDLIDHLIGHELAGRHERPGLSAFRRIVLDRLRRMSPVEM